MSKNPFKVIWCHKHSRVWAIVSIALIAVLIPVSIVSLTSLSSLFNMIFGPDRAVTAEGNNAVNVFPLEEGVTDKASSLEYSQSVAQQVTQEGITLLKNKDNALPMSPGKVSVFGKNSVSMAFSGSGSASNASSGTVKTIYDSLTDAGFEVNTTLQEFYENDSTTRSSNPGMDAGGAQTLEIGETPISSYTDSVLSSFSSYSDLAIIFLTRIGGEGFDLPRSQPSDSTKTFLDLYPEEEDLISMVESYSFKKIVVVVNAANTMNLSSLESDDKIDAILWVGFPGQTGIMPLGKILDGTINPSGHTADTYVKDFAYIPSYYNFGNNNITDGDRFINGGKAKLYYFVDYEENIYVGYRYFETGAALKGEDWYQERVLYPFGYGLSYTTFSWEVTNEEELNTRTLSNDPFTVSVKVTNTGATAGKDVVELYMSLPYGENSPEKAAKVLAGFGKTEELAPGEETTLDLTVDPYYFASWNSSLEHDGTQGAYQLEAGEYVLSLATDAHHDVATLSRTLEEEIDYTEDPVTGTMLENHFEEAGSHLQEEDLITRKEGGVWDDFSSLTPTEEDRTISDEMLAELQDNDWIDPDNPILSQTDLSMPANGVDNGMKLADLSGKDYDDPAWEKLLDQASLEEELDLFRDAGFHTVGMASIDKPRTTDADGPVGLTNFMGDPTVYDTVTYGCEVLTASTWNVDLAYLLGKSIGNEGVLGNVAGDGLPYTGWYAPGLNLHRNPFGGRACEYFSEDPYLSGMMGAYEVQGANSKGMTTYLKHFVGNEGETHRDTNGDCTFVNEQTLRELYLRPFEIAVKVGKSRGIMTSFNRIGTYWTGANYSLCTTVVRDEWGFHGSMITDFNTHHNKNDYMHLKPMLYAGGTLDLCSLPLAVGDFFDTSSVQDVTMLRKATHETLYAVANSNAMANEIDHYAPAYWKIFLLVIDIAVPLGLIIWGVFAVRSAYKKEKTSE